MNFSLLMLIIVVSYILGSLPTGLIVTKFFAKTDVRKGGSQNIGTLNAFRVIKEQKGIIIGLIGFLIVFLVDMGKAIGSVYLAINLLPQNFILGVSLASFFVVLGHNYSIFINFQGGRGAACLMGILLYLDWKTFLIWGLTILLFMLIAEILIKRKVTGNILKSAISDQIIGRLAGEVFALIPVYFYNFSLFFPTLFATILILVRHKQRLKDQIASFKKPS